MKLDLALIIRSEPDRVKLKGSTKSGIWEDTIVTEVNVHNSISKINQACRLLIRAFRCGATVTESIRASFKET